MKQFFKFMFASMIGTFVMLFIAVLIVFGMLGAVVSMVESDEPTTIPAHSILQINLNEPVPDRGSDNPLEQFNFETFEAKVVLGLNEILNNIEKAKRDSNIAGIYLNSSMVNSGFATIEEIRDALIDFKSSGKFIYSYAESYNQKAYYLASVADEIHFNPTGYFDLKGLSAQLMFFKGAMDKLEIEPQVFKHGKFKSAVEPFVLDKMSEENRLQSQQFVGSIWNHWVDGVSETRSLTPASINEMANLMSVKTANDALKSGLIDHISYQDQVMDKLKEASKIEDDLSLVSMSKYRKVKVKKDIDMQIARKNKIAVVYASGEIRSGKSGDDYLGSETIAKAISEARKDEKVKGIVLRVNSPGGSALASDVIWREAILAKEEKPFVVSMGDLAASGGYYISCPAHKIVANENTITGSIGVFGLVPNMQGMFNNKLGITFDTIKTNRHSDINTVFRPLTSFEKTVIQQVVDTIYDQFIGHVSTGRSMSKDNVDEIGQGRVWSGNDALEIGLVDEIGGLNRAIEIAVELAELDENHSIKEYPKQDDAFKMILSGFSSSIEKSILDSKFGENLEYYQQMEEFIHQKGIFTRIPFDYIID